MKATLFSLSIAAFITSCGNNNNSHAEHPSTDTGAKTTQTTTSPDNTGTAVDGIVTRYLQLKNALTEDNAGSAATAGKDLFESLKKVDAAGFSAEQNKMYDEVKEDMMEHAEHIGSNGGNIAHQREHFDGLSRDLLDLVKAVKPTQALYHDHCPMYNDKKGAPWLSETKDIRNPYYGKKMLECGEVKEEIK